MTPEEEVVLLRLENQHLKAHAEKWKTIADQYQQMVKDMLENMRKELERS